MRWRLAGWVALYLTTGCADFVGAGTDGAESGASNTTTDVATSAESNTGTATATATTSTSSTSTSTTGSSTPATDTGDSATTSTGQGAETNDASDTTRGLDTTSSESTASAADCRNELMDGDETDVDCGGSFCSACEFGESCEVGTDCATSFCAPSTTCSLQVPLVWLDGLDDTTLFGDNACTITPPNDTAQVYCWSNKGSHGGRFLDDNGQPVYRAAPGGLEFSNDNLISEDSVFDGPLGDVTVFLVQEELASQNSFDFNLNHPSENGNRYSAHVPFGNSNRRIIFDIGGTGAAARISTMTDVVAVDETHVFTFVNSLEDAGRLINVDGAAEATGVGAVSATAGLVSIGNGNRVVVHEFRVYSPSPTAAARQVIEGQLACRWDLRDQLPAMHPFYDANAASDTGCPPSL